MRHVFQSLLSLRLQRRTFFKSTIALSVGLIVWRQGVLVPAKKITQKINEFSRLEKPDVVLVSKLLPAMLPFKQWDVANISLYCHDLDQTISLMPAHTQNEIRQLFDLFHLRPFLWLFGFSSLQAMSDSDLLLLLEKMSNSRLSDFKMAAAAIGEIVCGVYYSSPLTDAELSYAPPSELL